MTAIKWSPRQQAAIEALGQNVLVSASAGAGKTSVLVARLMKRMEVDQVPIHHMVALTFTELASMEMRKRLAEELNERVQATHNPFLVQQIANLASAQITTIHGFCLTLIQNYAYVLGLDPEISQHILDEAQALTFKHQAFEAVYQHFLQQEPKVLSELIEHFDARVESNQGFKDNVYKLSNKLRSLDEPEAWLAHSIQAYQCTSIDELDKSLQSLIAMYFDYRIERLRTLIDSALNLLNNDQSLNDSADEKQMQRTDLIQAGFKAMLVQLSESQSNLKPFHYSRFRESFILLSKIGFKNTLKAKEYPSVNQAIDRIKRSYEDTLAILFDEKTWFELHPQLAQRLDTLARFTLAFQNQHKQLKLQAKVMDFDDMEQYALAIIKDTQFDVASQLSARYEEIVIDEFQDTNEVQNRIVELISRGNNIFRVGDVKQSIYRFRNAKPQMMMAMMQDASMMHLVLDENYRSQEAIVDFNNQLFDALMNFPIFTQHYTQDDQVKIGLDRQKGGEAIELHLIQMDQDIEPEDPIEADQEESLDLLEEPDASPKALYIISEIQRMLKESPYQHYKDYVILVRSNEHKALLKDLLQKARLPHAVSTKLGFYQADAIQDVLHLYHHLQNQHDDTHLVALLLSPYYDLSEAVIAQLFVEKPAQSSLYEHLCAQNHDIPKELQALQVELKGSGLVETFMRLIHFKDMFNQVGFQDQTNLDLLIQKLSVAQQNNRTVRDMVNELSSSADSDSSEAIVSTEEDDVIRVMTIHQSKGLEFKVVFFWSTSHGRIQDNVASLLMDTDLGMSLQSVMLPKRFTLKNPIRLAFEMKTMIEDVQEQLRLLYVALTRAQAKLIMVDIQPKWVLPLSTSTLLASPGSTPWMMAALHQNKILQIKKVAAVDSLVKVELVSSTPEAPLIATTQKGLSYQTPSGTHHTGPRPRLNFARTGGTRYGTRIHQLFETLPKDTKDVQTILAQDATLSLQQAQAILAFYQHPLYKRLIQGDIKHELPFYINLDQQVIHGYMDLVSLQDVIMVVDFKSDQLTDRQAFIEAYQDQINLYAKVLSSMYPNRTVEAYIYSMSLSDWIQL